MKYPMVRLLAASWIVVSVAACSSDSPATDAGTPPPAPVVECTGLECPPCATGNQCPEGGEAIDGTCCVAGDNLVDISEGVGSEVVDIETDGAYTILCGGFGANVSKVDDPRQPVYIGRASARCQRIAFGDVLPTGERVFYVAHHGDSWQNTPFLRTFYIDKARVREADVIEDDGLLFEGLAFADGYLYVAVHAAGIRVYRATDTGAPELVTTLGGFSNAWKIALSGDYAYVADGDAGLKVVNIADPANPTIVQSLTTTGLARDVTVHGIRVYVALGGAGIDIFEATATHTLEAVANIDTQGSAQAVAVNERLIAVANWSYVAVYDTASLNLLGTEKLRRWPDFEQDLGVALDGDYIHVGEWEGLHLLEYRRGYIAPDLWVEDELLQFTPDQIGARAVVIRNRGVLDLEVSEIETSDGQFLVDESALSIPPGGADVFEVIYEPPAPESSQNILSMRTNDPDLGQATFKIPLLTTETDAMDVGDRLADDFGFLDPNGAGQLSSLEGKVILLAYFALF